MTQFSDYAVAWFTDYAEKINFLKILQQEKFVNKRRKDEAFILCTAYLDNLSNLYQKIKKNSSWAKFCDLLINYSGNPLFSKVLFRQLLLNLQKIINEKKVKSNELKTIKSISTKFINYFNSNGCQLDCELNDSNQVKSYCTIYDKNGLISFVTALQILTIDELKLLTDKLNDGQGSIALFCYEQIRCEAIHKMSLGEWIIENVKIDFEVLYNALEAIFSYIQKEFRSTGEFLGNPKGSHPFSV